MLTVIVDECMAPDGGPLEMLRRRLGESTEFLFLSEHHSGIPDIEILDKLLHRRTVLLTADGVLHNRAIDSGFASFHYSPEQGLTDRPLAEVSVGATKPPSVHRELQPSYTPEPSAGVRQIGAVLQDLFSNRQRKTFRTKRRRIRSHFGSADNLLNLDLTITQRGTRGGISGGYFLKLNGRQGVKSLQPASEGYFRDRSAAAGRNAAVLHALTHLYGLQLWYLPATLYIIDGASLRSCTSLSSGQPGDDPLDRAVARMLGQLPSVDLLPCVKGRFFERQTQKLNQIARPSSNEAVTVDLAAWARALSIQPRPNPEPSTGAREAAGSAAE